MTFIKGPCIILLGTTTVLIEPSDVVYITKKNNLVVVVKNLSSVTSDDVEGN